MTNQEFWKQCEPDKDGFYEISFRVKGDAAKTITKVLEHCMTIGGRGHSFGIDVDKEGDEHFRTGFDGDGADRIQDIKVCGKDLPDGYGKEIRNKKEASIASKIAFDILSMDRAGYLELNDVLDMVHDFDLQQKIINLFRLPRNKRIVQIGIGKAIREVSQDGSQFDHRRFIVQPILAV